MVNEVNKTGDLATQAAADTVITTPTEEATPAATLPGAEEGAEQNADQKGTPGLPGGEEGNEEGSGEPDGEEQAGEFKGAPEDYKPFDISAGEAIGYTMSDEQKTALADFGKTNNLDDAQMANIINFDIARRTAVNEANNKYLADKSKEGIDASRKKYGDKYSNTYEKNSVVYNKFFPEAIQDKLNDYGISSDPAFFDALAAISAVLSEDVTVLGDRATVKNKGTLAQQCAQKT